MVAGSSSQVIVTDSAHFCASLVANRKKTACGEQTWWGVSIESSIQPFWWFLHYDPLELLEDTRRVCLSLWPSLSPSGVSSVVLPSVGDLMRLELRRTKQFLKAAGSCWRVSAVLRFPSIRASIRVWDGMGMYGVEFGEAWTKQQLYLWHKQVIRMADGTDRAWRIQVDTIN